MTIKPAMTPPSRIAVIGLGNMGVPMAYVAPHTHKVQEQVCHVLEGEGSMEITGKQRVVRRHDVIFIPPGVEHAIYNSGLTDLVFIVVTSPASDEEPAC